MNWQFIKNRLLLWLRRFVLYGGYLVVLFTILSALILQLRIVQEMLLERYTNKLTAATGFPVTFQFFYFSWWDYLHLEGLRVKDPENNVLIAAKSLHLKFDLTAVYADGDITLQRASLEGAMVHLQNIGSDSSRRLNLNVWIERINQAFSSGKPRGVSTKINIGRIHISKSRFVYSDSTRAHRAGRFDPNHLRFDVEAGLLSNFKVIGDTTQFVVQNLQAQETHSELPIRKLQTFFRYSQQALEFYRLQLETEKSKVADTLVFSYRRGADLSYFTKKVHLDMRLKNTHLDPEDVKKFTGDHALLNALEISGRIRGRVGRLTAQNLEVRTGQSLLKGRADVDGLPALPETFVNLAITEGRVTMEDLAPFLPPRSMQFLQNLGRFRVAGNFTGFFNDFVADAQLFSPAGNIYSNLNLKIDPKHLEQTTYKGKLRLADFDLGAFSKDTAAFQRVTLDGTIEGRGITLSTANFILNGSIPSIGLFRNNYTNIKTNAQFARGYFNGSLEVNDPNLQLTATGSIDLRNRRDHLKIKGRIDTARLDKLQLMKDELFVQTNFDINTQGLSLDSLAGSASLSQAKLVYKARTLDLPELVVSSVRNKSERSLSVSSNLVNGQINGDFLFSQLFTDVVNFANEIELNLANNREAQQHYYTQKSRRARMAPYATRMEVHLVNINPVLNLVQMPLRMNRDIVLKGRFSSGIVTQFQLNTSIDTVRYQTRELYHTNVDLSASKLSDSTTLLAMLTMDSKKQKLATRLHTENLFTEAIWDHDHIDMLLDLEQEGKANSLHLHSEVTFLKDSIRLKMLPSRIRALGEDWRIAATNSVLWKGKEVRIEDFRIFHEDAAITLSGRVSEQPQAELKLAFDHVNLALLNSFSSEKVGGRLNGFVSLQNVYGSPSIQNNVTLSDLTLNDFLIGTLKGENVWVRERNEFDLNFLLSRENKILMALTGTYQPADQVSPLHVQADFNKANIRLIEPLVKGIFSQLDGTLSGHYQITGKLSEPLIEGTGQIDDGTLRVDYLNTVYRMQGGLNMTASQIIFENMQLTDALGNKGELEGRIGHRNFDRFRFSIDCDFRNMQVLNTTAKDNKLFYGQAYSTGTLNIFGPMANLKISATARSEKNTRIFIPIGGTSTVEKKDFINFFHFTDSIKLKTEKPVATREADLSGFVLDLNLDVTPDAYAEIIFDIKAGDIIRGRGNGDLKLLMDSRGGFNMFGFVEFTEGAYNFTLYDIINKEFTLKPGSNIAWYGDPYQGTMKITASYRQLAALGPILADQSIITAPAIRRKYPVEVLLKLDGPMLSPQIQFDLSAPEVPDNVVAETEAGARPVPLKFQFEAFKARADEQELKKQVFSLIVLRRFSPPDAFNTSGTIQNSVSEFLSNQLSYWLSQMDQNLEIDFDLDLGTMNQEAFNTFQLRLSYSMLNGRLRITRDGTVGNVQTANVASVAGDWTVDYLLTPDGRFKVKMYSRSNFNAIQNTLGNQVPISTGISLLHSQNFNEVKDLLRSARDRRRRELKLESGQANESSF